MSNKNNKKSKIIQLQGKLGEIIIVLLERRMKSDMIETFKMINGISIYGRLFSLFQLELEIYCQD